jgi:transcription elongation factor Elf1
MPLTPEQQREALRRVAEWRVEPARPVTCPVCGAEGLGIVDRSVRPHAEWYALSCSACGLSETLHIPMGAVVPTLD